jgi:hypothetical protein
MKVLAELHREPDLKLNLKFEVNVLCKTLAIEIHNVKPGVVFKDHNHLSRLEPQLSQPQLKQMYQPAPQLQIIQQQNDGVLIVCTPPSMKANPYNIPGQPWRHRSVCSCQ